MADDIERKVRPRRDMCHCLDILPLHRGGFLAPGKHHGTVETLPYGGAVAAVSLGIIADMRNRGGAVAVFGHGIDQILDVERVRGKYGDRLLFRCRCGLAGSRLTCAA